MMGMQFAATDTPPLNAPLSARSIWSSAASATQNPKTGRSMKGAVPSERKRLRRMHSVGGPSGLDPPVTCGVLRGRRFENRIPLCSLNATESCVQTRFKCGQIIGWSR